MTMVGVRSKVTRWTLSLALSAPVMAAAGCMVGPDYEAPKTPMPSAYGEGTTALQLFAPNDPVEVRWWRELGDPKLAELVERAMASNYSVAVAQARLREARAARRAARSLLYPQVSIGASAMRFRGSEAAIGLAGLDLEDSLFQVGFDAAWVVDVFGGTRRGIESATANEEAAAAERRSVVLLVAAETARAYLELRGVQRQLEIDQTILEQQRQTLTVTEDRRRNGLSSDLEVLRARTEVESTAAEIPPLQQVTRQYIHVLSTLVGLQPTALSDDLGQPASIPTPPSGVAIGIPSDLLRRRPDIQAVERRLASATAVVGVAKAQLFPQMVLGGSGGLQSRDASDLFNGNSSGDSSTYYLAGPTINWTIFDGGRRKAGVEITKAQVDAAKAAYEDTVLSAFREVESALVAVDRSQERVRDLRRLSASARESAAIARRDYERGILDQLTVLDAQRQSNRADLLLADGEVSTVVNLVTLYKALGGGWEVAEPAADSATPANSRHEGQLQ